MAEAGQVKVRKIISLSDEFDALKDATTSAVQGLFPIVGKGGRSLRLDRVWIDDNKATGDLSGQMKAKLEETTWGVPLMGKISLRDPFGKVMAAQEVRLADIPKPTPRLSYIVGGQEYQVDKQWRLKPGIYSRVKENGEIEAHINVAGGERMAVEFDPTKRKFSLVHGGSTMPLFPIIRTMGADATDLRRAWGSDILNANAIENLDKAVTKFYKADTGKEPPSTAEAMRHVRTSLESKVLDPDVTKRTIGVPAARLDQSALLAASKKLLAIARGDAEPDERDALPFKHLHSTEDFIGEKIQVFGTSIKRRLANVVDRETDLGKLVYPGMLDRAVQSTFTDSVMARIPTQDNPLEFLEGHTRTTPLGQGGISDTRMIGEEMRGLSQTNLGYLDPIDTPEGDKVGIVSHLTLGASKGGTDVYIPVYDTKLKKTRPVRPTEFLDATVALPDSVTWTGTGDYRTPHPVGKTVRAAGPENKLIDVPFGKVDFVMPSTVAMLGPATNMIPFVQNDDGARVGMAARHLAQAVPLKYRETPKVQAVPIEEGRAAIELPGALASHKSPVAGVIVRTGRGVVVVKDNAGKTHDVQIYDYFPLNDKKAGIHSEPIVKVGDRVTAGQVIADSEYTRDGKLALGINARIGLLSVPGKTFEDGIVISEDTARRLTSTHLHRHRFLPDENTRVGKDTFAAYYPTRFNNNQLAKLDEHGVIREGQTVNPGDPLSVSLRKQVFTTESQALAKLKRSLVKPYSDASVEWDQDIGGKVVRVHRMPDGGAKVFVATEEPAQVADKISLVHGNKGIIVEIRPDAQMPHDASGKPIEIAINPYGLAGRMTVGPIYEMAAGKIADKTGQSYQVQNFSPGVDYGEKIRGELKQHGIEDQETLFDPMTHKSLGKITVGPAYVIKQRHQVERKISARAGGPGYAYDLDRQPRRGSGAGAQALGGLGNLALLAHGARNIIREAGTIKSDLGQQDELWRSIQMGLPLPPPKPTFVQKKFENYLYTLGVKLKKTGTRIQMVPTRDEEVLRVSSGEITKPNLVVRGHDLAPEPGGLFDEQVTGGLDGTKMSHIRLPEPIPNPFFERGVLALTGWKQTELADVLGGKKGVKDGILVKPAEPGAMTGSSAIQHSLKSINVDREIRESKVQLPRLTGVQLDRANKRLRYLEALKENGLRPDEAYMTSVVPVMPPNMRPIVPLPSGDLATDPLNETYKALGVAVNAYRKLDPDLPERSKGRLRKEMYTALAALHGVGAGYKRVQGGETQGIMDIFTQPSAKAGWLQTRLFKRRQDLSARSVVVPDPDLSIDEIEIPHRIATEIYKPFTVRELTRSGYTPLTAQQMIHQNHPIAEAALQRVVDQRPVLMKRDPVLHKYGIQAFKPKIGKGLAIKVPPLIVGGLNMDFDGNCCVGSSKVVLTFAVCGRTVGPTSAKQLVEEVYDMKFVGETRVLVAEEGQVAVEMEIRDVPYLPETRLVDRNGASVYQVPDGIRVLSIDLEGAGSSFEPVNLFTVEENASVVRIRTRKGYEVVASDNESLCVYNNLTGTIEKKAPKDSIGCLVPLVVKAPILGCDQDLEHGWMIGAFASDGFLMRGTEMFGYSKLSDAHRDRFSRAVDAYEGRPVKRNTYRQPPGSSGKLGGSAKDHFNRAPRCLELFHGFYVEGGKEGEQGERAALRKRLPEMFHLSEQALLGVLAGLLDGDGSVSVSHAKAKPQVLVNFSTSSPHLVESIKSLCLLLGVRCSATPYGPKEGRLQTHMAYIVSLSTNDIRRIAHELRLSDLLKTGILIGLAGQEMQDTRDIVPVPESLIVEAASSTGPLAGTPAQRTLATMKSKWKPHYRVSRRTAQDIAPRLFGPVADAWKKLVGNDTVHWDVVETIEPAGCAKVYDLMVPTTKVFAVNGGLVVWDTTSLFVPITPGAIEDARKMMPSANLLHPATGRPVYTPSNEMSLGLYRMTTIDPSKAVKNFKSTQEVLDAHTKGELAWDDVKINGKPTTVGRVRLFHSLPEGARKDEMLFDPDRVWNAKYTNSVLKDLALTDPQAYAQTSQKLMDLGSRHSYENAFTLGVNDFIPDKAARNDAFVQARSQLAKLPAGLKPREREQREADIWMKAGEVMEKAHWDKKPAGHQALAQMVEAGVKPGRTQYNQMLLSPVLMTGIKGKLIPSVQTKSYSEGVDIGDFFVHGMGARASMVKKTQEVREPGYLSKQMANTVADSVIAKPDCGTTDGVTLSVDHPDVQGRYLAKPVGPAHLRARELVTGSVVDHLRKARVQTVIVRSPLKCRLPQGICQMCMGMGPEGHLPEIGTNIGVISGQALGERSTQMFMRSFHCMHEHTVVTTRRRNWISVTTLGRLFSSHAGGQTTGRFLVDDMEVWTAGSWTNVKSVIAHEQALSSPMVMTCTRGGQFLISQDNHPHMLGSAQPICSCGTLPKKDKKVWRCRKCGVSAGSLPLVDPAVMVEPRDIKQGHHHATLSRAPRAAWSAPPLTSGWLAGIFCAEGCIRVMKQRYTHRRGGGSSLYTSRVGVEFSQKIGTAIYDRIHRDVRKEHPHQHVAAGPRCVRFYSAVIAASYERSFGRYSREKGLPDGWTGFSRAWLGDFLSGMIDGDGTVARNSGSAWHQVCVDTTSALLAEQIREIVSVLGGVAHVSPTPWRKCSKHQGYRVSFSFVLPLSKWLRQCLKLRGVPPRKSRWDHRFQDMVHVAPVHFAGIVVYDLETEHGTLVANDIWTHNTGGAMQKGGGAAAVSQFDRVSQVLRMPQVIPNAAVLSETQGKISRIRPDPAGGRRVTVGYLGKETEHHVPGTLGLAQDIRVGAGVTAGQPLSTGAINMHDLLRTAGLGHVQNQITNELDDIYRADGIRRRNIEVVTRGVTNLGMIDDPGDHPTWRRGDSVPMSAVFSWNDQKQGKATKAVPVLKGVGFAPLDMSEDWMAKLHHERLKDTLVDAALEGHHANVSGFNPFSAMAFSPATFGLGVSGIPGTY